MGQVMINWIQIFIIPFIVGAAVRLIFGKWKKGYLITVADFIAFIIAIIAANVIPNHGSELYGLMILRTLWLTLGSFMAGRIAKRFN